MRGLLTGLSLAAAIAWVLRSTRMGLILCVVRDSTDAAPARGHRRAPIRIAATAAGGAPGGIGGA